MRETEKQPTCKIVARRRGYTLFENGELWKTGSYPYLAGCLMMAVEEHFDSAIDEHEEELRCLEAEDWFEQSWSIGAEY
jgi:hypothetical protein